MNNIFLLTRKAFGNLDSNGKIPCPDCGGTKTKPYPNCGCPPTETGYGVRHINRWHHECTEPNWLFIADKRQDRK